MRLAAFNGSSRKNGNTRILLEIICDETRRAGIDSEIISLSDFPLRGCLGCFACKGQAHCITIDDGFNDCFAKSVRPTASCSVRPCIRRMSPRP